MKFEIYCNTTVWIPNWNRKQCRNIQLNNHTTNSLPFYDVIIQYSLKKHVLQFYMIAEHSKSNG